ncbi:ROK family protein [Bdellovibrionota bacterium FG-1]
MSQKASDRKFRKKSSTKHQKKSAKKTTPAPKRRRSPSLVLAYDLGGTKVAAGIVDDHGNVLEEIRQPVVIEKGKNAVIQQLADLGHALIQRHRHVTKVGVASAGPLDPLRGLLLDPTNFSSREEGTWGVTPLAALLKKKLGVPVFLENDAAAAILAEHWIGRAQGYDNAMILTLGTGLGTGIICNGELVRAGHHFHPEAGHIILKVNDPSAPCGCGNLGCAEAYLSGRNFGRRAAVRLKRPDLDAKQVTELARMGDRKALEAFAEYAEMMAIAIQNYVVIYCPEVIVLTGSFAAANDLFLEATQKHLEHLLARRRQGTDLMPQIVISALDNQAGLVGGAYIAFHAR